jgi:hypothetical protein
VTPLASTLLAIFAASAIPGPRPVRLRAGSGKVAPLAEVSKFDKC